MSIPVIPVDPNAQGLIFDCDGTLVDSMPIHFRAWQAALEAAGGEYHHEFIDAHKGVPAIGILQHYNQTYGTSLDVEAVAADKQRRAYKGLARVEPIVPVANIVTRLHGKIPMAVASGGSRENVERMLEVTGLAGLFETVITGSDPVPPKPDPAIFVECAQRMGISPVRCQVFEDGDPGLEAARLAGMIATDVRPYLAGTM